ncbi:lytic transglycosylase domain-containing protein [Mesobaculum littorinae]|uniref:Lytic transglycosylase domain-containing protein n=1 Tax=Mesobaculum littorinae TaxID=2486419 RepID=A0A438AGY5_9RHOB|nr:transglycosylase SLT domain-containing protein [Mesobaculum littorinae]RVV97969.1 lytic transglycosylase domain-containing protein [Mesobaculum littorinae]
MTRAALFKFLTLLALALPVRGDASADLCEAAAIRVAQETGVPQTVLRAISLTETGRARGGEVRPWPWTVNLEGAGHWFDDRDTALAFAYRSYKAGKRSFDLGCFQINYRWHGENFASLEEMFDPEAGARYAAGFLKRLHAELGDWSKAAGAYHSRTETYAKRYRKRFDRFHAGLTDLPLPQGAPSAPAAPDRRLAQADPGMIRPNSYPLLQGGQSGARGLGSLVPLGGGGTPFVAATARRLGQ